MGAHDRVPHWRVALYFFSGRRKGALARREIKDSAAALDAAAQARGQRVPRRRGTGEFGVAERQAVKFWCLDRIEDRPARWSAKHLADPVPAAFSEHDGEAAGLACKHS